MKVITIGVWFCIGLMILSLLYSFIDTPLIFGAKVNSYLCKYNRILCLDNLPPLNPKCDPSTPYPHASSRDLVIGMFVPKKGWTEGHLEMISFVFYLMRKTTPKVNLVMFLGDVLKNEEKWTKVMKTYNVTVEYVHVPEGWNMVNYRFVLYRDYLMKHTNDYDRVIFCDSKDIYFLRDPFTQIGMNNTLLVGREFRSADPNDFYSYKGVYQYYNNYIWMVQSYGEQMAETLKNNNSVINNAGFGGGDIKSMIKLLSMWVDEMIRIKGQDRSGFDQSVYNYLIYSGKLTSEMNYTTFLDCSHYKICMFSEKRVALRNGIPYLSDGCVPHVLHRDGLSYNMLDIRRYPDNGLF